MVKAWLTVICVLLVIPVTIRDWPLLADPSSISASPGTSQVVKLVPLPQIVAPLDPMVAPPGSIAWLLLDSIDVKVSLLGQRYRRWGELSGSKAKLVIRSQDVSPSRFPHCVLFPASGKALPGSPVANPG